MMTQDVKGLVRRLRSGVLDTADTSALERVSASEFIADLKTVYHVLFHERHVGRKYEVGMARSLQFELAARKTSGSLFPAVHLLPVLRNCLFVSAYDNVLGEVTSAASVHVMPQGDASGNVIVRMGRGFKLDRSPDGWVLKPLKTREVTLTEAFLAKRGWKFDAFSPFFLKSV
jgi:hypothetical protein